MKYLFVLIFIIFFIFLDNNIGYTNASPLWTHFTYMFQHAGIVHLILNLPAFIGMFRMVSMRMDKYRLAAVIYLTAALCSFLPPASYSVPTVGASGMIYAMIGIYVATALFHKILRINKKKFSIFLCSVLICLGMSYLRENSNFFLHLFCLIAGFVAYRFLLFLLFCTTMHHIK